MRIVSFGCSPTSSAGESFATSRMATRSGHPVVKPNVSTISASSMFVADPATNTATRLQGAAAASPPTMLGSSSPTGRTNPPNGIALIVKSVPLQW